MRCTLRITEEAMGVGDLTIQQLQEIKEAFELFDTDSSGKNPAPATHGGLLATGLAAGQEPSAGQRLDANG